MEKNKIKDHKLTSQNKILDLQYILYGVSEDFMKTIRVDAYAKDIDKFTNLIQLIVQRNHY